MHSSSSSCPLSHLSFRVVSCPLESVCFEEIEYVSRPIAALLPLTLTSPSSPPACQWSPSLLLPKTAYSQSTWPRQTLQTSSPGSSPSQRRTTRSLYVSVSLSAGRGRARASGSLCQLGFLRFPRRDPGLTTLFIRSSLLLFVLACSADQSVGLDHFRARMSRRGVSSFFSDSTLSIYVPLHI